MSLQKVVVKHYLFVFYQWLNMLTYSGFLGGRQKANVETAYPQTYGQSQWHWTA